LTKEDFNGDGAHHFT